MKMVTLADQKRYFHIWLECQGSWGQVVIKESIVNRDTDSSNQTCDWLTDRQIVELYHSEAVGKCIVGQRCKPTMNSNVVINLNTSKKLGYQSQDSNNRKRIQLYNVAATEIKLGSVYRRSHAFKPFLGMATNTLTP